MKHCNKIEEIAGVELHDNFHCGICFDDHYHPRVPTLWHACDHCDVWWCGECVGCSCDGPDCECGGGSNWKRHQEGCEQRMNQ